MAKKESAPPKKQSTKTAPPAAKRPSNQRWMVISAALAIPVLLILVFILSGTVNLGSAIKRITERQDITNPDAPMASFYAPEVMHWKPEIEQWAQTYDVNPNVIAIVIQIESCGDPTAISSAGATGLMQVMPMHFSNGENMLNPDTNVRRGMSVFYECLTQFADWDLGLALACYNGGPGVTTVGQESWAEETRYYYRWATGLWGDVQANSRSSGTLSDWKDTGGSRLCDTAAAQQES
jgi:soluble lytic murein transglycosylase-like protein